MDTNNHGNSGQNDQTRNNEETDRDANRLGNSNLQNEGRLGETSEKYDAYKDQDSKRQMTNDYSDESLTYDDFDDNDLDDKDDDNWDDDDDNWNTDNTDTDLARDRDL